MTPYTEVGQRPVGLIAFLARSKAVSGHMQHFGRRNPIDYGDCSLHTCAPPGPADPSSRVDTAQSIMLRCSGASRKGRHWHRQYIISLPIERLYSTDRRVVLSMLHTEDLRSHRELFRFPRLSSLSTSNRPQPVSPTCIHFRL